jgi:SAM-dependent methyltransferase
MSPSTDDALTVAVRDDFDRLAAFDEAGWSHNSHYHGYLLRQLPAHVDRGLDVGCGIGTFARLLAARAGSVLGLDFSAEMIARARVRSARQANITYEVADVRTWPWPAASFDCIASIATLHHLPLAETLGQMAAALRPGGMLLVLDLYQAEAPADFAASGLAVPVSLALRLLRNRRLHDPLPVREAWAAHGPHDHYLTLAEVRRIAGPLLPGARVRRRLLYRYSLVWRKPAP